MPETEARHFPFPLQREMEPHVAKRPHFSHVDDSAELEELRLVEQRLTATVLRLNGEIADLQALLDRSHRNYDVLQDAYDEKARQVTALEAQLTGRVDV